MCVCVHNAVDQSLILWTLCLLHVLGQGPQPFIFPSLLYTTPSLSQQPHLAVSISSVLLLSPFLLSLDLCPCLYFHGNGVERSKDVKKGARKVTSREGSVFIVSTSRTSFAALSSHANVDNSDLI